MEAICPALLVSLLGLLALLYVRAMVLAYRAAGADWQRMDRDVRIVFLLAAPLFRGAIKLLLLADRILYTPKIETMTKPRR
jgi:hypothetical protein